MRLVLWRLRPPPAFARLCELRLGKPAKPKHIVIDETQVSEGCRAEALA